MSSHRSSSTRMPSHRALRGATSPRRVRRRGAWSHGSAVVAAVAALGVIAALAAACGSQAGGATGSSPSAAPSGPSKSPGGTASAGPGAASTSAAPTSPASSSPFSPSPSPSALAGLVPPGPVPGLLLIADRANDRLLLVDNKKRIVWQYPRPGHRPGFPFVFDDDAFFTPDYKAIITNQEGQHTIQIISFPQGKVIWHYGHPGVAGSGPGYLHTPDDAYVLPDGTRQVADAFNNVILFISPKGRIVRRIGTSGVNRHDPPRYLAAPNGDTPLPGGGTLVTEIGGSYVTAISKRGKLLWSTHTPARYPSDAHLLSDGSILLSDYSNPGAALIIDRHGKLLWRYRPVSGAARLDHPSLALLLPNGLIAVNDDYRDRVVIIKRSGGGGHIVWQYGHTDSAGAGKGYLNTPDGMDLLPTQVIAASPELQAALRK
jgi:hypothetical protein